MAKIRQEDITSFSISLTKSAAFAITTTVAFAQGNLTKSVFSIGTVGGMTATDPIAVKEYGTDTSTGWSDEQDWTAYNQSYTTVIPVNHVSSGVAVYTTSTNASISIGDLVGIYGPGTWSTSGNLNTAKSRVTGAGSQNAGLVAGGQTGSVTNQTELFNGSSWSTSGNINTAKSLMGGAGSQNAGLMTGGITSAGTNQTELFNGSSWSAGGILNAARHSAPGAGSQNAGLVAGGQTGTVFSETELFNGSSWSLSGNINTAKSTHSGCGSQNAGLVTGGSTGASATDQTELHNQTLYRKIVNTAEVRQAKNIGIAFDVTSTTLSVKFNGYVNNINVTSSNSAISTAAQWVSKWVVLPRFNPNASTTNNPPSIVAKSTIEPEDFIVGWAVSRTQMQVFTGNILPLDRITRW